MRVYFVLEHVEGKGGVETVLTNVTNGLTANGNEVQVFLPYASSDDSWEKDLPGVHYYFDEEVTAYNAVQLLSEKSLGLSKKLSSMPRPDVIVATHAPHTVLYSRMAINYKKNPPIVSWLHNPPEYFNNFQMINYADIHWSISMGIKQKIDNILQGESKRNFYIGNPFDLNVSEISPIVGQHFVFIGRLENKQKRLDILLQALSLLSTSWTLDLFGTGPDEDKIKNMAIQLNISDKVKFHGWVDNPWNEIKNITCLVLSSDFEGMPMVIGEAMTRGIPVLSTDCETGPSDLIKNNENGWLTPTGNVYLLAETFQKISILSQENLEKISRNAKQSIKSYSVVEVLDRMKESLYELVGIEREEKNGY
ncbi:glycosyltransferase [Bacillus sp. AFS040349]|uniref:glycosyltransferase n=1 Tax=Bacillus sp. AFS040349 TaxID=2033502 RepID=UPI00159B9FFD|nr:glycosyltransferase [Bacillus sp. AFS040349]